MKRSICSKACRRGLSRPRRRSSAASASQCTGGAELAAKLIIVGGQAAYAGQFGRETPVDEYSGGSQRATHCGHVVSESSRGFGPASRGARDSALDRNRLRSQHFAVFARE